MNNKSQITMYIIIGLVLLLTISLITYFATKQIIKPTKFSKQELSVKIYAEDCIKQTAIQAVKIMGANAGYIDSRSFNLDTRPAEGDLLVLSEIGTYAIPYWWYLKSNNKCKNCFATTENIPTIEQIKEQLDDYIEENALKCLDFKEFEKQNIVVKQLNEIKADSYITEGQIRIITEYPLEITSKGTKTTIKKLESSVNLNLRGIYNLAKKIVNEEKEKAILEKTIMHLISAYSGVDFDKLPPIGAITHSNVVVNWPKTLVKQKIEQILRSYIQLIQVSGTKDVKQSSQGVIKALNLKFLEKEYPFKVSFSYLDWPIYFDLSPTAGGVLKPEIHKQNFLFDIATIQTNTYEAFYDISAPILMEIRDDTALGGEGYSFVVGLEVNIRDNKNIPEWHKGQGTVGSWDPEKGENKAEFEKKKAVLCEQTDDKWLCPLTKMEYDELYQCGETCYTTEKREEKLAATKTMFCNEEQKLSGEIQIKVLDAVTKKPIKASVSYICGNYMTCVLGGVDENGILKTKMPICIGGLLSANENNYYQKRRRISTYAGEAGEFVIELEPFKEFKVGVKKIEIDLDEKREEDKRIFVSKPRLLKNNQQVIILIEKVKPNNFDANLIQPIIFEGPASPEQKIKLVPGKYKVTAHYVDKEGFIVGAECKKICVDYGIDTSDFLISKGVDIISFEQIEYEIDAECTEYKHLPEKEISVIPSRLGGVLINDKTGYWEVTREQIDSSFGILDFNVLKFPTPTCTDVDGCVLDKCIGMDQLSKDIEYTAEYRELVEPRLS